MKPYVIQIAALNLAIDPHPPGAYEQLLSTAVEAGVVVKVRGEIAGLIRSANPEDPLAEDDSPVIGEIWTYRDISTGTEWFNKNSGKPVTEEELLQIHIPEWARPNLHRIRYIFFPSDHLLIYVAKGKDGRISPKTAEKLMYKVLNHPKVSSRGHGHCAVTLIPETGALDRILNQYILATLRMIITRPNPDDDEGDSSEMEVYREMEEQNADRMTLELSKRVHDARYAQIQPNERTRRIAKVAAMNGRVEAKVIDGNQRAKAVSTQDYPLVESVPISKAGDWLSTFHRSAKALKETILSILRSPDV